MEHSDFNGGDWGIKQPWNAPQNTFSATNMLVYRTGELGVRAGVRDVTPAGLAATPIGAALFPYAKKNIGFTQGIKVKTFEPHAGNTLTTAGGGNFTNTITQRGENITVFSAGPSVFLDKNGDGIYSFINGTLTQLITSATLTNSNGMALYGDRLVVATTASLRYNGLTAGVSDYTSWPAANIIPVGDSNESIALLHVQRGHLTILKETNGLYTLTGQLGVSEALRRGAEADGPPAAVSIGLPFVQMADVTKNGMIWMASPFLSDCPTSFDGSAVTYQRNRPFQNNSYREGVTTFAALDPEGVLYTVGYDASLNQTNLQGLMRYNGIWTKHAFGIQAASNAGACFISSVDDPSITATSPAATLNRAIRPANVFVFTDLGATTTAPKFWSWVPTLDRPGYDSIDSSLNNVNAERAGDDSSAQVTGTVEFPEMHLATGTEILVRGVTVDFRSWNTKGSLTNHFDLEVDVLRPYDGNTPNVSLTGSWDEAGTFSSTAGTVKRQTFLFGDQGVGNGYQLKFSNVRGIAFQRFQVVLETEEYGIRGV
jgi:hypothetical protein